MGEVALTVRLRETATARAIVDALPIASRARLWSDEVSFSVPVSVDLAPDAKGVIEPGEIAFWTDGQAIAVGFGPTPVSGGDEVRLDAPMNIRGDAEGDARALVTVVSGAPVTVRSAA